MQMPVFLILFLAPVWVPYDLLTGWVQAAASVNPITLLIDTDRGFLDGDADQGAARLRLVALLLISVIVLLGPRRAAQRRASCVSGTLPAWLTRCVMWSRATATPSRTSTRWPRARAFARSGGYWG